MSASPGSSRAPHRNRNRLGEGTRHASGDAWAFCGLAGVRAVR
ncbi:hypothetical protein [Streptomyces sp. NPDC001851]